jgi:hypothetical protein
MAGYKKQFSRVLSVTSAKKNLCSSRIIKIDNLKNYSLDKKSNELEKLKKMHNKKDHS